jgi:hypothetical protein
MGSYKEVKNKKDEQIIIIINYKTYNKVFITYKISNFKKYL